MSHEVRVPTPDDYAIAAQQLVDELSKNIDLQSLLNDKALSINREVLIHLGMIARELRPHPAQGSEKLAICRGLAHGAAAGMLVAERIFGDASLLDGIRAQPEIPPPSPQVMLAELEGEYNNVSRVVGGKAMGLIVMLSDSMYINQEMSRWFPHGAAQVIGMFHRFAMINSK